MSVKICGHKVRWQKPIKIYTLLKASCALLMLCALMPSGSHAAEMTSAKKFPSQASSGKMVPCSLQNKRMDVQAPRNTTTNRTQRTAGPSIPAMALVMALGLRNIPGPVEQTRSVSGRKTIPSSPSSQRQALLLPGGEGCPPSMSANPVRERLAMVGKQ